MRSDETTANKEREVDLEGGAVVAPQLCVQVIPWINSEYILTTTYIFLHMTLDEKPHLTQSP